MSSESVGAEMVEVLRSGRHPFVMCNFAPPDMVGHTGVYDAAVKVQYVLFLFLLVWKVHQNIHGRDHAQYLML